MKKKKPLAAVLAIGLTLALVALLAACGGSIGDEHDCRQRPRRRPGRHVHRVSADARSTRRQGHDHGLPRGAVLTAITASRPQGAQVGTPPSGSPMPQESPPAQAGGQQADRPDPGTMFSGALDDLASAGTITAARRRRCLTALSAAMPQQGGAPGA